MFDALFAPYLFRLREMDDAVYNTSEEFIEALEPYREYLGKFHEEMEMDDEFYL